MKLKLITLTALGALALGSSVLANDPADAGTEGPGGHGGGRHHMSFDRITEQLNLTPEQKAKVQPIIDQAKPQLEAIHRDAIEKSRTVMENAMAQIRPLLTPEQQKKLDDAQNDRAGRRGEGGGRRHHRGQDDQGNSGDNQ
ncbi:MAG TPA: hypothetical protein VGF73_03480 [Chthoniobacterales bacterium]|jgi:Spy/CpxP family protein refolding chaperone